jgi:hypothetical protein
MYINTALTLLGDLADRAVQAGGPGLSRAAFISGALRDLSVALCRSNASMCRSGAYVATRAAGWTPMRGLARPSVEVVSACLAPRVWVWGVWFGFALRSLAMWRVCAIAPAFPAGGPFLPSLSVTLIQHARETQISGRAIQQLKMRLRRLDSKLRLAYTIRNWRSKKQVERVEQPVICFLRPELINLPQGG